MRGVVTRSPFAGGQPERKLAAQYNDWAGELSPRWPRTGRVLKALAGTYERDARHEDETAEHIDLLE